MAEPSPAPPALITSPQAFQAWCEQQRSAQHRLGFVPTMGALHEGHLSLVREAKRRASRVAVSIFVNPTQFAPTEDLGDYPRPLTEDLRALTALGVDAVFTPNVSDMYRASEATRVSVTGLTSGLCGASRPDHFRGVTTVVTKLLGLSGPCVAVFGQKDFQQLAVVKRMVGDLFLPVEVVGHPIVRAADGLALSSRNAYLNPQERIAALGLVNALRLAHRLHGAGERDGARLRAAVADCIVRKGLVLGYAELVDPDDLKPIEVLNGACLLALAASAGATRLIDNTLLGKDPSP